MKTMISISAAPRIRKLPHQKPHRIRYACLLAALWAFSGTAGLAAEVVLPDTGSDSGLSKPTRIGQSDRSRTLSLVVDFASVIQIAGSIGALVLGNPSIADANLSDGQTIVLTGRSVGTTNLIVLDQDGEILANMLLQVSARKPGLVTVRRALVLKTYSCSAGLCEGTTDEAAAPAPAVATPAVSPGQ